MAYTSLYAKPETKKKALGYAPLFAGKEGIKKTEAVVNVEAKAPEKKTGFFSNLKENLSKSFSGIAEATNIVKRKLFSGELAKPAPEIPIEQKIKVDPATGKVSYKDLPTGIDETLKAIQKNAGEFIKGKAKQAYNAMAEKGPTSIPGAVKDVAVGATKLAASIPGFASKEIVSGFLSLYDKNAQYQPTNKVEQFFLGTDPIKTFQTRYKESKEMASQLGGNEKQSRNMAVMGVGLTTLLDVTGITPGKGVAKEAVEKAILKQIEENLDKTISKEATEFIAKEAKRLAELPLQARREELALSLEKIHNFVNEVDATTKDVIKITDPAQIQEIKNSIQEGETILKYKKSPTGRTMSNDELAAVRRSVDNSKAKIGLTSEVPIEKNGVKLTEMDNGELTLPEMNKKLEIAQTEKTDPAVVKQIETDIATRERLIMAKDEAKIDPKIPETGTTLSDITTKPELFQYSRRFEPMAEAGYVPAKVEGLSKVFNKKELKPIEVGVFDNDVKYTLPNGKIVEIKAGEPIVISGHNRLELIKRNIDKIDNVNDYIKVKRYPGDIAGVDQAIKDSIMTNVRNKSIKEIEILDNSINGFLDVNDLSRALDFDTAKVKFFTNISESFKNNGLVDFWNKAVAPKLSNLKQLDFGVLQERLNFVERVARRTSEAIKNMPLDQATAVKNQVADKIAEFLNVSKKATLSSVESQIGRILETIQTGGFKNRELTNLFGEIKTETFVQARSQVTIVKNEIDKLLKSPIINESQSKRLVEIRQRLAGNDKYLNEYLVSKGGLTGQSEKTRELMRNLANPSFDLEEDIIKNKAKLEWAKIPKADQEEILKWREITDKGDTRQLHSVVTKDGKRVYDPERAALHDRITDNFLNPDAMVKPGEKPHVIILTGRPGSGKTSTLYRFFDRNRYIIINNDDIKVLLPEINDFNSFFVHNEAGDIKKLLERKVMGKYNIVLDITGGNKADMEKIIDSYKKIGYNVSGYNSKIKPETSLERTIARFNEARIKGEPARIVPPNIIMDDWRQVDNSFNSYKNLFDDYKAIDNEGVKPVFVEGKNKYGENITKENVGELGRGTRENVQESGTRIPNGSDRESQGIGKVSKEINQPIDQGPGGFEMKNNLDREAGFLVEKPPFGPTEANLKEAAKTGVPVIPSLDEGATYSAKKIYRRLLNSDGSLSKISEEGVVIANKIRKSEFFATREKSSLILELDKSFKKVPKNEFEHFGDYVEGILPVPEHMKEAVATWRKISKRIADDAEKYGIKIKLPNGESVAFKAKDNYYPWFVNETKMEEVFKNQTRYTNFLEAMAKNNDITVARAHEIISDMVNGRADFYGHLERAREAKLPMSFYERDPRKILSQYISEAYNRIGDAREFGGDDKILQDLIETARIKGADFEELQALSNRFLGRDQFNKSLLKVSSFARQYNNYTKLSLAAITNIGDLTKTFERTNVFSALKGIVKSFTKEGKEFSGKAGVLNPVLDQFAKDQGLSARFYKYSGFQWTEQKLRQIQSNAARNYINMLARKLEKNPNNKFVWRRLEQFNLDPKIILKDGLKESDYIDGAIKAIADTQPTSRLDVPYYWQSPTGKLLTQYKTFAYKQMKFTKEFVWDEAKQGNIKPLLSLIIVGTALGEGVGDLKAWVRGRQRPNDPGSRIIDNLMTIGGIGLASDFISNLQYGTMGGGFLKFVAGPTLSDIDAWLTAIQGDVSTIIDKQKRFQVLGRKTIKNRPQFKTLKKIAYSLPFIGPALANKMFPTLSTYKARTIPIADDILQMIGVDNNKTTPQ